MWSFEGLKGNVSNFGPSQKRDTGDRESIRKFYDKHSLYSKWFSYWKVIHFVKSVRIPTFSGPHFPTFGLNTKRYSVSLLCISLNAGKYGPIKLLIQALFTQWLCSIKLKLVKLTWYLFLRYKFKFVDVLSVCQVLAWFFLSILLLTWINFTFFWIAFFTWKKKIINSI